MKFIIYTDKEGKRRWKLCENDGTPICDSKGTFNSIGAVRRTVKLIRHQVYEAKVIEEKEHE